MLNTANLLSRVKYSSCGVGMKGCVGLYTWHIFSWQIYMLLRIREMLLKNVLRSWYLCQNTRNVLAFVFQIVFLTLFYLVVDLYDSRNFTSIWETWESFTHYCSWTKPLPTHPRLDEFYAGFYNVEPYLLWFELEYPQNDLRTL